MELSDWCEQVPHGQYFQPIRLRLDGATDRSTAVAPHDVPLVNSAYYGTSGDSSTRPSPTGAKRRHKPSLPQPPQQHPTGRDVGHDGVVLLPPFQSAHIGGDRMVLNVGGPVWAMDWLPHDIYRATATAAAKHKKAMANNKENVSKNVGGSVSAAATAIPKDPLAEWRLLALSTHPPCKVVDGKLVKNTPPEHYYDAPQGGRGLIQIWAIPVAKPASLKTHDPSDNAQSPPRMMPRLVYAIDHDSGVAWDLQWSPLTHKMPRHRQSDSLLGVLAIAFGDGSLQIFEVPVINPEKLQPEPNEHVVERLRPLATCKVERVIQLSVRWSPLRWNLLLSGCSDGSVALWNVEEILSNPPSADNDGETLNELEPQRRFQDADTIGKQEPFDWGWGWVAIRAVTWSPLDENLFATTGNDSLFKIWDIREPRICFRSHRIRSTWGLSMQWMDDTFVQISGDQGSIYTYDVLSGSYQKLHFHPQIDSPVWDLQYARRGGLPLLVSSCTSGSLRLAPAKKLFRAPQNSIEICRLQGEKDASVEHPHKSLTLSFEHRLVSGTAEAASPATREFCERDASLHRVRLSTMVPGSYPCFLATAGHAGLVVIMEMQQQLDQIYDKYFLQPNKKIGRPRKVTQEGTTSPWGRQIGKETPKRASSKSKRPSTGSNVNLSSFVHGRPKPLVKPKPKNVIVDDNDSPEVEIESESEAEYQEDDDEGSESDSESISLGDDDNSDDDRVTGSEDDESDEIEVVSPVEDQTTVRMRQEYQLDLSEEDALLLAIQMSEMDQTADAATTATMDPTEKPASKSKSKKLEAVPAAPTTAKGTKPRASDASKRETPSKPAANNRAPTESGKKAANTTEKAPKRSPVKASDVAEKSSVVKAATSIKNPSTKAAVRGRPAVSKSSTIPSPATAEMPSADYVDAIDQATIQMMIYQQEMTEEEALRQAIRMSEADVMRRSNRKRKAPTSVESKPVEPVSRPPVAKSQKRTSPANAHPVNDATVNVAAPDNVTKRLEFTNGSPELRGSEPPAVAPKAPLTAAPLPPKPRAKPASTKSAKATKHEKVSALDATVPPKQSGKRPSSTNKSTKATAPSSKKSKSMRSSTGNHDSTFLTEEELIAIALQTSQIEY